MNKLALVAAALLVLSLLALPRVVGSITEARVRERVAAIDASPHASAEVTSFDRGWFRSTAKIELEVVPDDVPVLVENPGTPLGALSTLPITVEFAHGPIAVLDGVHFGWSKMVARADAGAPDIAGLEQTLGVPYLFEFRGRKSYVGGLRFDADAPPFELPIDAALLEFSGATLAGTFAANRLAADAQIGSVEITSPTGTFSIRELQVSLDNVLRSRYVMPGESSLSVASIAVGGPLQGATPIFEAANLRVRSHTSVDTAGELLDMRVNYDVDSVRAEGGELTAAELELRLRNLDVAAIEAYSAAATDAAAAGADPAALVASFGPHLERALRAGPSLALDPIRFRYDGEPFEGRVDITTNTARLPSAGTLSFENPLMMIGLVNTRADVRVSKALAGTLATLAARTQLGGDDSIPPDRLDYMAEAQSGLMLAMLVGQGVLVEDGDGYRTSLDYTDGALTLNGSPLPFGLP
jgi:uncharacterized protein YdgA (DUF945 family)